MKTLEGVPNTSQRVLESPSDVLKARAVDIARPRCARHHDDAIMAVHFRLAGEKYAVEQRFVREVQPFQHLTPLPCIPSFLPGVVNIRGRLIPVLDIRKFFDFPDAGIADLHVVILVAAGDMEVGILADSVTGAQPIVTRDIETSLPTLTDVRSRYLRGVTSEQIVLLDVFKILSDSRIVINHDVECDTK